MKSRMAAGVAILALSGCAADLGENYQGGLTQPAETKGIDPVGGIVGGSLVAISGAELTRRERLAAINAEYRALESTPAGEPVAWGDEGTGHGGTVTAAQPYRVGSQDCRPYTHVVRAGGAARSVRGTACRNADGSWTLLN